MNNTASQPMDEIQKLKELAGKAKAHSDEWFKAVDLRQLFKVGPSAHEDAALIAAASPDVVLRLCEVAEKAKAVAFSNGFDAAYPDKLEALRASLRALEQTNG